MADINSSLPIRTQNLVGTDAAVMIGDGTDTALVSAAGELSVTGAVTNAGTFAVQESGAGLTALQLIDDAVHVDDAAYTVGTSKGVAMMGAFTADTVDAGDVGALAMDASRRLLVSIEADNAGIGGGTEYTEDVATANPIVGKAIMVERDDVLSTITPIEGDNAGLRGTAEGALWTQDFNSDAILADTTTIAGAVSGTEMQVDVVASLPAGTNAIGKLAANSGVDIGDVDVTSVIPGTGATNLGKAEDAAHTTGDVGVMAMSVRQDTAAALSGTDADYQPLITDSTGKLHVRVGNTEAQAIPVYITGATSGGEINNYDTSSAIAAAASDNHDYTVTGAVTYLKGITASASGKMKITLQTGPVAGLVTRGIWFTTSANPNLIVEFPQPIEVPVTSTGTIRIIRTNLEGASMDVYSTINGVDL